MDKVNTSIANLRKLEKEHIEMGMKIMKAADGNIYPLDIIAVTVLNRSLCLMSGFCDLIEKKNFISATPLIRLQLDNLIRFQAGWLVEKPHDFAMDVFKGKKIRDLKDKYGKSMTDAYLIKKISVQYPELEKIYNDTSGFIHLSDKHIFSSFGNLKDNSNFNTKISSTDSFVSEKEYLEAARIFFNITGILFLYLNGWALSKDGIKK